MSDMLSFPETAVYALEVKDGRGWHVHAGLSGYIGPDGRRVLLDISAGMAGRLARHRMHVAMINRQTSGKRRQVSRRAVIAARLAVRIPPLAEIHYITL